MSDDQHLNGEWKCKIGIELIEQKQMLETFYNEVSTMLEVLKEDQKHLQNIAVSNSSINSTLSEIRNSLLNTVLGKEIVPIAIVQSMIEEQRKAYLSIIKVLCWAFAIITLVLTGLKLLAPHLFA